MFVFKISLLCVLDSKELLSESEEEGSSCVRMSVHSFSCCIPLTLLDAEWKSDKRGVKRHVIRECMIICGAVLCVVTSFKTQYKQILEKPLLSKTIIIPWSGLLIALKTAPLRYKYLNDKNVQLLKKAAALCGNLTKLCIQAVKYFPKAKSPPK